MGWAIARPAGPVGTADVAAAVEEKEMDTVVPACWGVETNRSGLLRPDAAPASGSGDQWHSGR
jgi:hypothetical protein